jgi:hypothetical protein
MSTWTTQQQQQQGLEHTCIQGQMAQCSAQEILVHTSATTATAAATAGQIQVVGYQQQASSSSSSQSHPLYLSYSSDNTTTSSSSRRGCRCLQSAPLALLPLLVLAQVLHSCLAYMA